VHAGRDLARAAKVEHIIRNLDGTIGERNTLAMTPATSPAETHAPAVARAGQSSLRRPAAVWDQVRGPATLSLAGGVPLRVGVADCPDRPMTFGALIRIGW
jgi:hypothetical protein